MTIARRSTANPHRDRGSLSVVMMFLTVITLGAAGLVVDGGRALAARRHAAGTAEAAARFAIARHSLSAGWSPVTASEAARSFAERAGVERSDVEVVARTRPDGRPEIVVTITERRTAVIVALGGVDTLTVRATGSAIAAYSP